MSKRRDSDDKQRIVELQTQLDCANTCLEGLKGVFEYLEVVLFFALREAKSVSPNYATEHIQPALKQVKTLLDSWKDKGGV